MKKGKLDYVDVYYSKSGKTSTSMNPMLSDRQVKNYFKVGKVFNVGRGEKDYLEKVTKVVIHRRK